ncbi:type II toxin-antitoxin system PemK/MazF family toxin [Cryobacterium adonitolivorans]|uniref:Type II toxin-antitoxin system PemK/MazF family toxin n=1 Tax=Cryobacterium adonitolivorans TaxID=1259189 RepID=A0A4V3IC36_9MICO|nr:type II toxin-antitoxin system PemK/MazF family toxin [Cryobacterium adonitolivorans]TFB97826.1 type II toxin-antitoxin system PemK/MazF family toxin [Cryobacterium adonitolivorans]
MSRTRGFLTALRSALFTTRTAGAPRTESVPVQSGPDATVELDPSTVRRAGWGYAPKTDGALDPGEVVWTWVPFEERDGRGKDRPVVIVATLPGGNMLAVQLTSTDHSGNDDYLPLGVGPWDPARRPSWAGLARVFQVRQGGVRREGTVVDAARYGLIERALRARYGWR